MTGGNDDAAVDGVRPLAAAAGRRRRAAPAAGLALAFSVAAALALAGCGSAAAPECVRVVSWADYRELEIDRAIVDSFQVRHPEIPVCYESLEGSGIYREKVLTSIAAGTPPGVFLLDGIDIPAFVAADALLDLSPYVDRAGVALDAFEPQVLAPFHEGGLWAFPKGYTPMVIYYNKDLFDAAGVPYPEPGWTWSDFLETAKSLTRDLDGDGAVDQWGFGWPREFFYLQSWIWAGGGELLSPDGTRASGFLDSPETVAAVRFYLELATRHGVAPRIEMFRRGLGGLSRLFYSGRVAMLQSGHWSAPRFQRHEDAGRLRWGVAPFPVREGAAPATALYASGWAVPKTARHRRWAVQLAAFLASETAQRMRSRMGLELPALRAVAGELAAADTTGRERVFLDAVAAARHPWGTRVEKWREVEDVLFDLLDRPLLRGEPVQAVAAELAARIDTLLAAGAER
ncbi:MAG TPA: sugar ABC transporter substrate-binding protein [Longimicrobiales bacterium]